eukprot:SAG31_NODE_2800_length_5077_cov_2.098433_4_plen_86_part_00
MPFISPIQLMVLLVALAACTHNPLGLINLAKATPTPTVMCEGWDDQEGEGSCCSVIFDNPIQVPGTTYLGTAVLCTRYGTGTAGG